MAWQKWPSSINFLLLTGCFALCVPTNETVGHGILGAWSESHFQDRRRFKNPKNKLRPQRGATGDSNTCKTFQPLPPTLRSIVCALDSRFNTPEVLPSVALSINETFLVLPPAVALSCELLVFRVFAFSLTLSFALALERCVLLFVLAIVDPFPFVQALSFGWSLLLACSLGRVPFPPRSSWRT